MRKTKISRRCCAPRDNYILQISKSCASMRSFVGRGASIKVRRVPSRAAREVTKSEPPGLLRRPQTPCAPDKGRTRFAFTASAGERSAPHLRSTWDRDRLLALPPEKSAWRFHQRSFGNDRHARQRSATRPDGVHDGARVEALLSRPRSRH